MDDRLRETLSAMMDDEADELAVRRLLSSSEREAVCDQWQRWQHLRNLMHDESSGAPVAVNVAEAVRQQLNGSQSSAGLRADTMGDSSAVRPQRRLSAIALVALSVLIGFGMGASWDSSNPESATQAAAVRVAAGEQTDVPEVAIQGLDQQQWETFSRYLLEHAQHNSVGAGRGAVGYARLASVSGPGH